MNASEIAQFPGDAQPRDKDVQHALDAILQQALRPVAVGLALLYAVLAAVRGPALGDVPLRRDDAILWLTLQQALIVVALVGLYYALPRTPAKWSHRYLAGIATMIASDSVLHMYLVDEVTESITFLFAILGLSFLSTSLRWHLGTTTFLVAAWVLGITIGLTPTRVAVQEMGMAVFIGTSLSIILFFARRSTLVRLEGLRLETQRLNENLRHANRELDAFAYRVSHDLNTPLTTLKLQLHLAKGNTEGAVPSTLVKMENATRIMQDLVTDLLWLSRAESQPLRLGEVNISLLARHIVATLEAAHPDRNVLTLIDDDIIVEGDAGLLRVVLLNLLQNAWKFTAGRRNAVVEVQRLGPAGAARATGFRVRDNGAGFDPREASRMFQAFQRLDNAKKVPGTGLGLATVARIIERHGGSITATGIVDQGATFTVTLPP